MSRFRAACALAGLVVLLQAARAGAQADSAPAMAEPAARTLQELLERVQRASTQDAADSAERERRFAVDRDRQQAALDAARAELAAAQKKAAALEQEFESRQRLLEQKQEEMRERLGSLGDLLEHLGAIGTGIRAELQRSITGSQLGSARIAALDSLLEAAASGERLPAAAELETLWLEMQREMTESGRVLRYPAPVVTPDGARAEQTVVRLGVFNAVTADGAYLAYRPASGDFVELARQPRGAARSEAAELAAATAGPLPAMIDPTGPEGGALLGAVTAAPDARDRARAAGFSGWLALLLGLAGSAFGIYRLHFLERQRSACMATRAGDPGAAANPLARLFAVRERHVHADREALGHVLHAAVLHELPAIEYGMVPLRVIATVAPLLGLLGTVGAMIGMFELIAIDGLGDPRGSAGGLSQALTPAVLGVGAALPLLVLHALVRARAHALVHLLDAQLEAMVAARSPV